MGISVATNGNRGFARRGVTCQLHKSNEQGKVKAHMPIYVCG